MARFFSDLKNIFGEDELYTILNVTMVSSIWEVKKAYYKCSVEVHPNFPANSTAFADKFQMAKKFQALGKVYSIMSDKTKRTLYNREGAVAIETHEDRMKDYGKYWLQLFGRLDFGDIDAFEANYRGSSEELSDLKAGYTQYEGDMYQIIANTLFCGNDDDLLRYRGVLKVLIETNQLSRFEKFEQDINVVVGGIKKKANRSKSELHRSSALPSQAKQPLMRLSGSNSKSSTQPLNEPSSSVEGTAGSKRFKRVKAKAVTENISSSIQLLSNTTNGNDAVLQSVTQSDVSMDGKHTIGLSTTKSTHISKGSEDFFEKDDIADSEIKLFNGDMASLQPEVADNNHEGFEMSDHQQLVMQGTTVSSENDSCSIKTGAMTNLSPSMSSSVAAQLVPSVAEAEPVEHDCCVWQSIPPTQPSEEHHKTTQDSTHLISCEKTSETVIHRSMKRNRSKSKVKISDKTCEAPSLEINPEQTVASGNVNKLDEASRSATKSNADTPSCVPCNVNDQSVSTPSIVQFPTFKKRMQMSDRCKEDAETSDVLDDALPIDNSSCCCPQEDVASKRRSNSSAMTTAVMQNGVGKRPKLQPAVDLHETAECTGHVTSSGVDNKDCVKIANSAESNVEDIDSGKCTAKNRSTSSREVRRITTRSVKTQHSCGTKKTSWKAPIKATVSTG